jgi:hypothetical protein
VIHADVDRLPREVARLVEGTAIDPGWLAVYRSSGTTPMYVTVHGERDTAVCAAWPQRCGQPGRYRHLADDLGQEAVAVLAAPGLTVPGVAGASLTADAVADLRRQLSAVAGPGTALAFSDVAVCSDLYRLLRDAAFREFPTACDYVLDVSGFETFDDYVSWLPRQRRSDVRRERRVFADTGYRVQRWQPDRLDAELAGILSEQRQRYGDAPAERAVAERVAALRDLPARRLHVLTVEPGAGGFAACLLVDGGLHVVLSGTRNHESFAYFNLIFYAVIELALELGVGTVHLASTADQAKLARGFTRRDLYILAERPADR